MVLASPVAAVFLRGFTASGVGTIVVGAVS
jgi:hypothetical protein